MYTKCNEGHIYSVSVPFSALEIYPVAVSETQ